MTDDVKVTFDFDHAAGLNTMILIDSGHFNLWTLREYLFGMCSPHGIEEKTHYEIDVSGSTVRSWRIVFTSNEVYVMMRLAFG